MLKEMEILRKFIVNPEAWVLNAVQSGIYSTEEEAVQSKVSQCIERIGCDCIDSAHERLASEPTRKEKQEAEDSEFFDRVNKRAAEVKERLAALELDKKRLLREEIIKMKEEGLI